MSFVEHFPYLNSVSAQRNDIALLIVIHICAVDLELIEINLNKKKLVCLVGMDGTGKTSHAIKLVSDLKSTGTKCKYVWLRLPYFVSLPFMASCRIIGFTDRHVSPQGKTISEHHYYRKPISLLWPWIQLVDLVFFILARIYIPIRFGYLVVCDRFVHDVLVDVMVDIADKNLHRKKSGRLMLSLVPQDTVVCVLDTNERIAFGKKSDIPSLSYLIIRRECYRLIAADLEIPLIEASESFDLVHRRILDRLLSPDDKIAFRIIKVTHADNTST